MTPARFWAGVSFESALNPPLNLNAPIFWKFSHLRKTLAPVSLSRVLDVMTGVLVETPSSLLAA